MSRPEAPLRRVAACPGPSERFVRSCRAAERFLFGTVPPHTWGRGNLRAPRSIDGTNLVQLRLPMEVCMLNLPLERQLVSILANHREDSFATQRKRAWVLKDAARRIVAGFGLQKWDNLGLKHVRFLIDSWKSEDHGRRAIEEKLTHLRWLVGKIGKQNLIPRSNHELGIEPGPRFTRAGHVVPDEKLLAVFARLQEPR